jgi:hypothetical protein
LVSLVFPATPSRLRSVRGGSQTMHARPLISTRGRSVKHMGAKAPPDKRRIFSGGGPAVVHQGLLLQPNPLHPPGQPSASIRLRMQHRANAEPGFGGRGSEWPLTRVRRGSRLAYTEAMRACTACASARMLRAVTRARFRPSAHQTAWRRGGGARGGRSEEGAAEAHHFSAVALSCAHCTCTCRPSRSALALTECL